MSARGVTVWRTCSDSVGGECVGRWDETQAPALAVAGVICLVFGAATLCLYWLLRRRYSDLELMPRLLGVGAQLSLAALGIVLLIGGASRSSLDVSWQWIPVWLPVGLAALSAALLLHRKDRRTRDDWIEPRRKRPRVFRTLHKPPA